MRISLFVLAGLLLACHTGLAGEPVLAFQRDADIFITHLDGKKPRKLISGDWPDLSPDGSRVACNTQSSDSPERHIAIVDVGGGRQTVLKGIPSDNCHSPIWSPDARQLVFQIFSDDNWHLGLVDAGGGNFRYLHKTRAGQPSYWGAVWAPDGRSLFCQDMNAILHIGLDGKVLQKWRLTNLIGDKGSFNSGSRLAVSHDGRTLLFDADMDEEVTRKDWEGPPPAIWKLHLATGKAERITPPGVYAWQPCWISSGEILCTTPAKAAGNTLAIRRLKLADATLSPVVSNACAPSLSAPVWP